MTLQPCWIIISQCNARGVSVPFVLLSTKIDISCLPEQGREGPPPWHSTILSFLFQVLHLQAANCVIFTTVTRSFWKLRYLMSGGQLSGWCCSVPRDGRATCVKTCFYRGCVRCSSGVAIQNALWVMVVGL